MEKSVIPAVRRDHWTAPAEQVPHRLADARLERRERARRAAIGVEQDPDYIQLIKARLETAAGGGLF